MRLRKTQKMYLKAGDLKLHCRIICVMKDWQEVIPSINYSPLFWEPLQKTFGLYVFFAEIQPGHIGPSWYHGAC